MNHAIPDSLVRYQQTLEEAIRSDLAGAAARRRDRIGIRILVAGGATAAVALGALSLLGRGVPSAVAPASAAIIRHAEAALAQTPGTILHIAFTGTQDNGDGTTVTWSQESYSEQRPPYDTRLIDTHQPGTPSGVDQATVNGVSQVYDPTRNTIYIGPPPSRARSNGAADNRPRYRFGPGPTPGTRRVRVPVAFVLAKHPSKRAPTGQVTIVYRTVVVTSGQARALRHGTEVIRWTFHRRGLQFTNPRVVRAPRASSPKEARDVDPFSAGFRGQILALLRSGHARVGGRPTIDGRVTIEIQSADGHTTYYVDPGSYTPVELTTRGTTGGTGLRFTTYQELPLDGNSRLLSLTAQHPAAKIDRNVSDYNAAQARLFPHG